MKETEKTYQQLMEENEKLHRQVSDLVSALEGVQHAQEAITKSKRQWQDTFDSVPDLIAVIDEKHIIRRVNKPMAERLGLSPKECIGKKCYQVVHGLNYHPDFCPHAKLLQDGCMHEADVEEPNLGGIFNVICSPVSDAKGKVSGSIHVARDISWRKQAEESILARNRFLQTLMDTVPIPIFYKDTKGLYLGCNRAFEELTGKKREELTGKNVYDLWEKDLADKYLKADQELFANPGDQKYETQLVKADGSRHNIIFNKTTFRDSGENISGLIGSILDVTEVREKDRLLRVFEAVMEQSIDAILIMDTEGIVEYVNPQVEKKSGYGNEKIVGSNLFFPEKSLYDRSYFQEIWDTVNTGKTWRGNMRHYTKDGSFVDLSSTIFPIFNEKDEIVNFVAESRDITQEKMLEEQLFHAQKMEAIGTFAGGISHDFNNILGSIMGFAEMMIPQTTEGTPLRRYAEKIMGSARRAKKLIKQILAMSRKSAEEKVPVNINGLLSETVSMLRSTIPATIQINCSITDKAVFVIGDSTKFQQIIMNLGTNAFHAIENGKGILDIELDVVNISQDDLEIYPELKPGRYSKITVSDTGSGIPADILDKIFDPYFSTKETGKGTGLGLSVVHGIVSEFEGAVRVESEIGRGTVFTIMFPAAEEARIKKEEITEEGALRGGSESILFVDDEDTILEVGKSLLVALGYKVIGKKSSLEAMEELKMAPHKFDLIITDYSMPYMSGVEFQKQAKSVRDSIPVVLCTGFTSKISKKEARNMGFDGYLEKPFSKEKVARVVRKALDGRQLARSS